MPWTKKKRQESVRQAVAREARRSNGRRSKSGQVQSLTGALISRERQLTVLPPFGVYRSDRSNGNRADIDGNPTATLSRERPSNSFMPHVASNVSGEYQVRRSTHLSRANRQDAARVVVSRRRHPNRRSHRWLVFSC